MLASLPKSLRRDLHAPSMSTLICCGQATAITALGFFVLGLVFLAQSDLIIEPLIKQVHPIVLSADTLIAIGDLHGDLEQGYTALKLAGLVNTHNLWAGGQATLVQTGDLLDRGPNSIELVQLFERLKVFSVAVLVGNCENSATGLHLSCQGEAAAAGGTVHTLMGNHETMNLLGDYRYVSQQELATLGGHRKPQPLTPQAVTLAGLASWQNYMQQVCKYGVKTAALRGATARSAPAKCSSGNKTVLMLQYLDSF